MRTLLIDNYDSFTYNLYQLLGRVNGRPPTVLRNDEVRELGQLDLARIDAIVVSPGPGRPDRTADFGISRWAVRQPDLPVLGVCLGHQGLCWWAGARVERAPEPMHGRLSAVHHSGDPLFEGIPSPFEVVRYHSLLVYDLPAELEAIGTTEDGLIMAVRHRARPHWGVQFHPESIATRDGERLLANYRDLVLGHPTRPGAGRRPVAVRPAPAAAARQPPAGSPYRVHVRELAAVPDAEAAFVALFGAAPTASWLDSSRPDDGLSRFSVLAGAGPLAELVTARVGTGGEPGEVVRRRPDGTPVERYPGSLFDYLDTALARRRVPDAGLPADFNLGYVGYLGYELKADCGAAAAYASTRPDGALLFSDRALVLDHRDGRAWLLALGTATSSPERWLAAAAQALRGVRPLDEPPAPRPDDPPVPVTERHSAAEYAELIAACQEEIAAGESYEICLTNMLRAEVAVDPWLAYRVLRRVNPAPYAAFLRFPEFSVLSSSPERFLRIDRAGEVESKPIKGTRPRGRTPEHDAALVRELRTSEKERAENLMIVDLVRNDIGRVAEVASVTVPALFAIETYQTVHQLVSTVRGRLDAGVPPVACVRAAFPGGSMTGAPKLRTMEIIDRLEGAARGVYSGALGAFSLNGAVDLSIVIRTMVVTPDEVSVGVGGAITALSDPAEEIEETRVKAHAILRALAAARSLAPVTLSG
jgi:para-aminobenzoate synthetase